jgi:hypothetical protein
MKKWIVYGIGQVFWIALHYRWHETGAFWFGAGEAVLAVILVLMLLVAWTEATWGKGE